MAHVIFQEFDVLDSGHFGLSTVAVKLASLEFVYLHSVVMHIVQYFGDLTLAKKLAKGLDSSEMTLKAVASPHSLKPVKCMISHPSFHFLMFSIAIGC